MGNSTLAKRHEHLGQNVEQDLFSEQCCTPRGSSSWAPAIHTKILCSCLCSPSQSSRYMAQSSTVCFLILPRLEGSTKRLVRPVQSTIGPFKNHVLAIRKLVKEFAPGAVYTHSFRENRSQTKIGHGVAVTRNNRVRVVLSRGPVFQTW